jgi:hypothetical protein
MASTFLPFTPSTTGPQTFQPVIAGQTYNAEIDYNAFDQRFYLNLTDLAGEPVHYCALAETGPSFQATLNWALGVATVALTENHNVPIAQMVLGRISGTDSGFDGFPLLMLAINATTLTYQLATDPEVEPVQGLLSLDVNLLEGVIPGALFVYHSDVQQFEFA